MSKHTNDPDGLWIGCAGCREERIAEIIRDAEAALFTTGAVARARWKEWWQLGVTAVEAEMAWRAEWREIRRLAIEMYGSSSASARPTDSAQETPESASGRTYKRYSSEEDGDD